MTQCTTQARGPAVAVALVAAVAAVAAIAPAALAHDCSGFNQECGAQFHTDNTVTGGKQVGDVVTCTVGQAHASPGEPTYTGRFQRGSTPIPGTDFNGTTATYTLTDADVGFVIVCIAEARHSRGNDTSESSWHGPVTARPTGPCASERRGSDSAETMNGTAFGDRLLGLGGDDVINGLQGDDCLVGGFGDDRLTGSAGDDQLSGEAGEDVLTGATGRDVLSGGSDSDTLDGGQSADRLSGGSGGDRLAGGAGGDTLTGGTGDDRIDGGPGRNSVSAGSGDDTISAANGQVEIISCGGGRDRVRADRRDRVAGCETVLRLRGG